MFKKLLMVGALLSASTTFATTTMTIAVPYLGAGVGFKESAIQSYKSLTGNVFAGYAAILGEEPLFYLAEEIFLDMDAVPFSSHTANRDMYGLGFNLLPGIVLNKYTVAYTRVGVELFRHKRVSNTKKGAQLGAGIQTNLAKDWDFRAEYIYTGNGLVHGFNTARSNQFKLGVVYKFS